MPELTPDERDTLALLIAASAEAGDVATIEKLEELAQQWENEQSETEEEQ